MKKKAPGPYTFRIVGQADSAWRGAVPDDCADLKVAPEKNVKELLYMIVKAEVERLTQKGDTKGAAEAVKKYQDHSKHQYANPLNVFKKDKQNGDIPCIGAHCLYGGFRDAAVELFPQYFYKTAADRGKKPSNKHLRKYVHVRPYHVFLHRPSMNGNGKIIKEVDGVHDQHPTPKVGAFCRYEFIDSPFQFEYLLNVSIEGPFKKFLENQHEVKMAIVQSANAGQGGGRAAGYGMWRILKCKVEDGLSYTP